MPDISPRGLAPNGQDDDVYLSTVARYLSAAVGLIEVRAVFPEKKVTLLRARGARRLNTLYGDPAGFDRRTGAPVLTENAKADGATGRQPYPEAAQPIGFGRERRLGHGLDLDPGGGRRRKLSQQRAAMIVHVNLDVDRELGRS